MTKKPFALDEKTAQLFLHGFSGYDYRDEMQEVLRDVNIYLVSGDAITGKNGRVILVTGYYFDKANEEMDRLDKIKDNVVSYLEERADGSTISEWGNWIQIPTKGQIVVYDERVNPIYSPDIKFKLPLDIVVEVLDEVRAPSPGIERVQAEEAIRALSPRMDDKYTESMGALRRLVRHIPVVGYKPSQAEIDSKDYSVLWNYLKRRK